MIPILANSKDGDILLLNSDDKIYLKSFLKLFYYHVFLNFLHTNVKNVFKNVSCSHY